MTVESGAPVRHADDAALPVRRRIAVVISHLGAGGAERVLTTLARYWSASGHDVSLVTLASRRDDLNDPGPQVHRVALDLVRPARNPVDGAVMTGRRLLALRRALSSLRPDVVVSFLERTNVLTLLATLGTTRPVFVCERSDPRHDPIGAPWAALRRLVYPRAAGVVVQTESVARWARAFCPNVYIVPNFVDRPRAVALPGREHGPFELIALGRLSREKGFDLLVEAFARVAQAFPDWTLTIVGEGPERAALERSVRDLGLAGRVALPGHVRDPGPLLAAAHAFALPSRYEGFPNALIEAMACGLPVVAFRCESGPAEIVTDGEDGLLVESGDVGGLADALAKVMGSSAERARLGCNASQVATRLAPGPILDRWSKVLLTETPRWRRTR